MTIEVLFGEVCGLYGDRQNAEYLKASLPQARFVETALTQTPLFVQEDVDMLLIGSMSEKTQRQVIEKLRPYRQRLAELIDRGVPILATGNACEIFCSHIDYLTEETEIDGLGFVELTVKTKYFGRYNGKVLGELEGMKLVGFRSQFSFLYGDNSQNSFLKVLRGDGINKESKLEGFRVKNLMGTQLLGPILPLNPLFCEHLIRLAGGEAQAAFREEAMAAYHRRVEEFSDPNVKFGNNI